MLEFEVHGRSMEIFGAHMMSPWDSHGVFWVVSLVSCTKPVGPRSENGSILVPVWTLLDIRKSCESVRYVFSVLAFVHVGVCQNTLHNLDGLSPCFHQTTCLAQFCRIPLEHTHCTGHHMQSMHPSCVHAYLSVVCKKQELTFTNSQNPHFEKITNARNKHLPIVNAIHLKPKFDFAELLLTRLPIPQRGCE